MSRCVGGRIQFPLDHLSDVEIHYGEHIGRELFVFHTRRLYHHKVLFAVYSGDVAPREYG